MKYKLVLVIGLVLISATSCTSDSSAVPEEGRPYDFSYSSFARLLESHVANGLVDYESLKSNRARLDSLITNLGTAGLSGATDDQRLAFYINAYNMITLRSVVDAYPIESIKDIDGVWTETAWLVAGQELTLDEIEHDLLRKEFDEPRIHVAINCAAFSCPALASTPYYPDHLDSQLTVAARRFARSDRYNQLNTEGGTVKISAIFDWFGDDFVSHYSVENQFKRFDRKKGAALSFLAKYLPEPAVRELLEESYEVEYLEYDWSLNDQHR